jgi:hypothetical protein
MERNRIYMFAALSSIALYMVGVFSGALIYSFTEDKISSQFDNIYSEIDNYNNDLESIKFQQLYLSSNQELGCGFAIASLKELHNEFQYFWEKLPDKLEVYDKYYPIDEEYENIKRKYMEVSIKAWLLSLSVKDKCGESVVPILYFYSGDCEKCIEQGYILDNIRNDTNAITYTVDLDLDLEAINIIKETYNITKVPSLLINDKVYSGLMKYEKVWEIVTQEEPDLYY